MENMDLKSLILQNDLNIDQESVDVYKFLKQSFPVHIDDNVFRFTYRSFYRMDSAGLTEELKSRYFDFLKEKETSLQKILEDLHKIKTEKKINTYQFSFATKLLHTIDNNLPIYDSQINYLFKFPGIKKNESPIQWRINTYNSLKEKFYILLNDNQIKLKIKEFKKKFNADIISDLKMLDFMLWSLGKRLQRDKKKWGK